MAELEKRGGQLNVNWNSSCDAELLRFTFESKKIPHFTIINASHLSEALQLPANETFDFTIHDLGLPDNFGLGTLHSVIDLIIDIMI
ncbi:hypothetical protein [Desulfosediminicola ganghwensis]|uniref:hypothetical protein n=1 Tax=Desulfosediminicola ganghwensis TaxID=2569540 RepID=UPI0010AC0A21|nr:hypothetical protein [Desulfosediminicola ganghwensis]